MNVDYTTWCDATIKSGVKLAEILNQYDDAKLSAKVNTHIHRFNIRLKSVNHLEKNNRQYIISLLHNDAKLNVMMTSFPNEVKTFLLNLMATKYKQQLNLIINNNKS